MSTKRIAQQKTYFDEAEDLVVSRNDLDKFAQFFSLLIQIDRRTKCKEKNEKSYKRDSSNSYKTH